MKSCPKFQSKAIFSCSMVRIGEKVHEIETFHHLLKNSEQAIKETHNSKSDIYSTRYPCFGIISSYMFSQHVYLPQLEDNPFHNFCLLDTCMTIYTVVVLRVRLNGTLQKHRGLVGASRESPHQYRVRAFIRHEL